MRMRVRITALTRPNRWGRYGPNSDAIVDGKSSGLVPAVPRRQFTIHFPKPPLTPDRVLSVGAGQTLLTTPWNVPRFQIKLTLGVQGGEINSVPSPS